MNRKTFKKRISFSFIYFLVLALCSQIGYAYGAYLDSIKFNNSNEFTADNLSTYFAGGSGTETDPYQIATADQLRNLQKLNMLSAFSQSSNFILNDNITWSGESLLPIGSEDYPFDGQFNGNGKTISGLVVNGQDTDDIGMFGYTGINSHVRNLILSKPTINVSSNTDGGTDSSDNPLNSYLDSVSQNLASLSVSGSTITVPSTSVSVSINGSSVDLPITWTSSDTAVLTSAGSSTFSITNPDSSKVNTKGLYTAQLTASTHYVLNGKYIKYTIERFNVEVSNSSGYSKSFKNLWPSKADNEDTDSTHGDDYYYHKTYVGFFIGHCDGGTAYLGMDGGTSQSASTNGSIVVNNRAAYSYQTLIGKTRSDNPKDATASNNYNKYFNFAELTQDYSYTAPSYPVGTSGFTKVNSSTDVYETSNAHTLTDIVTGETDTSKYCRIYPSSSVQQVNYKSFDSNGNTVVDDQGEDVIYTNRALQISQPLQAGTYFKKIHAGPSWAGANYGLCRGIYVNNGLWIWTSSSDQTFFSGISGLDEFYIDINISYVANCPTDDYYFQTLYNAYNYGISANYGLFWSYNESHAKYATWKDLAADSTTSYTPQKVVDSNDPLSRNGYIQEKTISIYINKTNSFWGSLGSLFSSGSWSPALAIGVGKNGSLIDDSGNKATTTDSTKGVQTPSSGDCPCAFNSGFSFNGETGFSLYILSMEVLFTSSEGNTSSLNNHTDYLYDTSSLVYDSTTKAFTTWNRESNVKVGFDVSATGQSAIYSYYRSAGYGGGINSTVYARYSNGNYIPFNTNGYKNATISAA